MSLEVRELFERHFGEAVKSIEEIKAHGSSRVITRFRGKHHTAIGVQNADIRENQAFIYFSRHFLQLGLNVPKILEVSASQTSYLQEDLGDLLLLDILFTERTDADPFPKDVEKKYQEVLTILPRFQVQSSSTIDFSNCHKFAKFDTELMLFDMRSFRDQYLLATLDEFDGAKLEKEFKKFAEYLSKVNAQYFMYRDLQARNILIHNDKPYFIDYQGGCQGALQYDVASLLFQSQARVPQEARERLLQYYLDELKTYIDVSADEFLERFYAFVILRIMQVLGTYGLRGLKERKQYFIDSIDLALENLKMVYTKFGIPIKMPEFEAFIKRIEK